MAIEVSVTDGFSRDFPDATGWHVDDDGRLHIIKMSQGNIATFHPNAWICVEKVPS